MKLVMMTGSLAVMLALVACGGADATETEVAVTVADGGHADPLARFNPQPDPPGFNPQPDPPGFNPQPDPPGFNPQPDPPGAAPTE